MTIEQVANIALSSAVALAVIALVVHVLITRGDAKKYRDAVRTLGDTERDRDKYKTERDAKTEENKSLKVDADTLRARVDELEAQLKEKRREALEHAPDDQLLDDVDRLSDKASGRR